MPKVKEIRIGVAYTVCPKPFHPIRGEYSVVADVAPGETLEGAEEHLLQVVTEGLLRTIDNVVAVHNGVESGTAELGQLTSGSYSTEDSNVLSDEDDWD